MADYYATAIIGCKIPEEKLYKVGIVAGCKHLNLESAKFCPECGKKAWKEEKVFILRNKDVEEKMKDLGIRLVDGTEEEVCVIGLNKYCTRRVDINYTDGYDGTKETDFTSAREQTMYALDQLGMWNPKTFGLWVVGFCSC